MATIAAAYVSDPNNRVSVSETFHDKNILVIILVIFVLILGVGVGLGIYMANKSKESAKHKFLYSKAGEILILSLGGAAILALIILGIFLVMVFPGPMIVRSDEIGKSRALQAKNEANISKQIQMLSQDSS